MSKRIHQSGTFLSHSEPSDEAREVLNLGLILGQRRALAAVNGRCTAAHAQILRRIRNEKLYLPIASSWREFCSRRLNRSRRNTDRIIALLDRFGPIYFELAELHDITPKQYLSIEPAIQDDRLLADGEAISLIPANAPKIVAALERMLARTPKPPRPPQTRAARIAAIAGRCRDFANQLIAIFDHSDNSVERELIVEAATELRLILMQAAVDAPNRPEGGLTRA
jgi:hypothetical protein